MNELAIIIPAYKALYFGQALESLAAQTNKNFTVYVGDDKSPEDLGSICEKFKNKLNLRYFRFERNLGSIDLVGQWARCIGLSEDEPWLWLFSDDDLVDPNCVEQFYKIKADDAYKSEIYKFSSVVIDKNGKLFSIPEQGPAHESALLLAYNLLKGNRGHGIADHIFSRVVYDQYGLVKTDFAQGADWASAIQFARQYGLTIIPDAKFYWRLSGNNLSANASNNKARMINGHLQFIRWILDHFSYLKTSPDEGISYEMIQRAALFNLTWVIKDHYRGYPLKNIFYLAGFFHKYFNISKNRALADLVNLKLNSSWAGRLITRPYYLIKMKLTKS